MMRTCPITKFWMKNNGKRRQIARIQIHLPYLLIAYRSIHKQLFSTHSDGAARRPGATHSPYYLGLASIGLCIHMERLARGHKGFSPVPRFSRGRSKVFLNREYRVRNSFRGLLIWVGAMARRSEYANEFKVNGFFARDKGEYVLQLIENHSREITCRTAR